MKSKEKLLEQISEFNHLQTHLAADCAAFCKDRANPIEDRWALFCEAPQKDHQGWDNYPHQFDVSPYDDFGIERHETFDVCDKLNDWQESLEDGTATKFVEKLGQENLNVFKEHYMDQYLGSWEHDW